VRNYNITQNMEPETIRYFGFIIDSIAAFILLLLCVTQLIQTFIAYEVGDHVLPKINNWCIFIANLFYFALAVLLAVNPKPSFNSYIALSRSGLFFMDICTWINVVYLIRLNQLGMKKSTTLDMYIKKCMLLIIPILLLCYITSTVGTLLTKENNIQGYFFVAFGIIDSIFVGYYGINANLRVRRLHRPEVKMVSKITLTCVSFAILYIFRAIETMLRYHANLKPVDTVVILYLTDIIHFSVGYIALFGYWKEPSIIKQCCCPLCF